MFILAITLLLLRQVGRGPAASPQSADEIYQSGLRGIQERRPESILAAFDQLAEQPENQDQVQLLRGAWNLLNNQPELALADFGKIAPNGRLRDPLLVLTGEALYRLGRLDDAEHCLTQAVQDSPNNADALRWLATVQYDAGNIQRTLELLAEVIRSAPTDFRPHHMLGSIYVDFGEHLLAIPELERALQKGASDETAADVRRLLATSQMALKQFDAALSNLQNSPPTPVTLALQADCLWQKGQTQDAQARLAQAEALGSLPPSGVRLKARILMDAGDLAQAQQQLEGLVAATPSDDESLYLLALIFRQQRNEPQHELYRRRSESTKALKTQLTDLSQTAMQEPDNAEVRDQLAAICDQLGLQSVAQVWRTAAASCRRRSGTAGGTP